LLCSSVIGSSIVFCMLAVILSAYIIAFPLRFLAARPIVCVSERWLRKSLLYRHPRSLQVILPNPVLHEVSLPQSKHQITFS
jgi:ABC-type molybdate transport system permease subunit